MAYMHCYAADNPFISVLTLMGGIMVVNCMKTIFLFKLQEKNTKRHLSCSENVAYETVGSTVERSTQANVSCSENVAYATVNKSEDNIENKCTGLKHVAVYEEMQV